MTLWEMKEESFNEGIAIGKAEGKAESVYTLMAKGMSLDEACAMLDITPEEYETIRAKMAN